MTIAGRDPKHFHIAFSVPARVMLGDKSTPLVAATVTMEDDDHPAIMVVTAKRLFPANAGPVKASIKMAVNRAHVVSIVEVPLQ